MTTIKQVFLGAAVAGVVAGAGSAVGTAVAYADGTGADATNSSATSDAPGKRTAPSRNRNRAGAADSSRSGGTSEAAGDATPKRSTSRPARTQSNDRDVPDTAPTGPLNRPVESVEEPEISVPAPVTVTTSGENSPAPAAAAPAAATVLTVAASPAVAAPAALAPAPAAPAPTPLRLPLLPDLPALPVGPASAVTASTTSGANNRLRAASAVAQAAVLADPPNHVLLIGTDGTNLSKILEYAYDSPASGFRAVMQDGVTGTTSLVGHTTISGPSWSTILTGAWDNKTGIINNLFNPAPYTKWPTVFNLIEYNKPAVNTAVVADWQYINDIADAGGYPADTNEFVAFTNTWEDTDDVVAAKTIDLINAASAAESNFIFSYQVAVDEEGHLHGGGSQQYADAVINTSDNIKAIMTAVEAWETANPGEQWTIIVTTDHGHQQSKGFGHGFQSPNETSSFVMFDLEGDDANNGKQNLGYTNADITPTILNLFDIAQRSDFDGVPLQDKASGNVDPDDLKQALSDALSMYGYPNIGTDIALGARTVFASVPYFIDGFINNVTSQLQAIVDKDIFLISGIAQATEWVVQFNGDLMVGVTQAVARVVAHLTGSGTIAPTDDPLPPPPAEAATSVAETPVVLTSAVSPLPTAVLSGNLLTNPGAEFGDASLSGFSAVSIPGWTLTGTPTVIGYGTPRNFWPMGLSQPTPNLPKFFSFPQSSTNPTGGTQFFGGGNVASATLTQTVDISAAQGVIDAGGVSYDLGGEFGGFLIDPSAASIKVTFLDQNMTYLGTASTKPVGMLSRLFMTGFKERSTAGTLPIGTRYAQVELTLDDNNWRLLGFRARYNNAYADNLSFTIGAALPEAGDPTPVASTVGDLDHVFMVYMENKGYDDIVGSPNAPFLNSLINNYGFIDNYYGLTHPSLPNYYPILGGSDFGKTYNCKDACIDAPATLMENLDNAGLTWRSYAQGFEAGMNPLESSGEYAVDETAFPAYTYFANNPDPDYVTDHIVPLTQMAIDLQSLDTTPDYVWFAADENSNGEGPVDFPWGMLKFALSQIDPKHQYNVPALDEYLSETVPVIMNSNAWNSDESSVLVVTFDEDNNNTSLGFGNEGNHIVTVVIPNQAAIDAGMRAGHYVATGHYNHYSLLRMIEDALDLPTLTKNDAYAAPMNEVWGSTMPGV